MPRVNVLYMILALMAAIGAPGPRGVPVLLAAAADMNQQPAEDSASDQQPAEAPPLGESPLLVEPKTPEAMFDAVVLMVELARPRLARDYLEKMMSQDPDNATILRIRDKHGPEVFLRLANVSELQPLSVELLDRMNAAMREFSVDPSRIDQLIRQLSGSSRQRDVAMIQLRNSGAAAVPRLLRFLGDPKQAGKQSVFLEALTRLGREAIPPLRGALDAPDPDVRAAAVEALGWLGDDDTVPYLWYPAFSSDQPDGVRLAARQALSRILLASPDKVNKVSSYGVVAALERAANLHYRREHKWLLEDDGTVLLWMWRAQSGTAEAVHVAPEAASLFAGTRFASQAFALAPTNRRIQALYLGFALASDAYVAGWGNPIPTGPGSAHDLALLAGADVVAEALAQSLENANPAAGLAAIQVLGQIGTRHQLGSSNGRQSPIVAALNYPDARVQFAAASAILQFDPEISFAGSSRVVAVLTRALADEGRAHGLVIDANTQRAGAMAGILQQMGYTPEIAQTGQDGFRVAADRGDVELILVEVNALRWGLSQTVANLRADARTANIPIAIYGDGELRPRLEGLVRQYPLVTFIVESTDTNSVASQVRPFLKTLKTPPLSQQQRTELRAAAAYWIAHIANGRRTRVFDLRPAEQVVFRVTDVADLASNAIMGLGAIATQTAQERLQEIVVNTTRDASLRERAALQLAFHIQRFGLLLSEERFTELYASWKTASEAQLKTAMASVIGSLKPNAERVSQRLSEFPQPSLPPQPMSASPVSAP